MKKTKAVAQPEPKSIIVVGATLPTTVYDQLNAVAKAEKRKRAQMIRVMIEEGIERRQLVAAK